MNRRPVTHARHLPLCAPVYLTSVAGLAICRGPACDFEAFFPYPEARLLRPVFASGAKRSRRRRHGLAARWRCRIGQPRPRDAHAPARPLSAAPSTEPSGRPIARAPGTIAPGRPAWLLGAGRESASPGSATPAMSSCCLGRWWSAPLALMSAARARGLLLGLRSSRVRVARRRAAVRRAGAVVRHVAAGRTLPRSARRRAHRVPRRGRRGHRRLCGRRESRPVARARHRAPDADHQLAAAQRERVLAPSHRRKLVERARVNPDLTIQISSSRALRREVRVPTTPRLVRPAAVSAH